MFKSSTILQNLALPYVTNFSLIPLRGSYSMDLSSLLSQPAACRYNLVFNQISAADLPTTRNVPVTLTKRVFSETYQKKFYLPSLKPFELDMFQNRGWTCEIVLLFVTINQPDWTKTNAKALGYWITAQGRYRFRQPYKRTGYETKLNVYPDSFYFLFIPSNAKVLVADLNSPIYE